MPTTALLDLSPTGATAKSGNLTPSGRSAATSVTSISTNSVKDIFQAILPCLQHYRNTRSKLPPALVQLAPEFAAPPKLSSKPSGRPQRMQRPRRSRKENLLKPLIRPRPLQRKRITSFPPPRPRRLRQDPRKTNSTQNWWRPPKVPQSVHFQGAALPPPHSFPLILILTESAKGLLPPPPQSNLRLSAPSCPHSQKQQRQIRG
jgi:hypothetical protein